MTTTSIFDAYFLNRDVLISWKEMYHIEKGNRVFTIVNHFKLYDKAYLVIKDISEPRTIMVEFDKIRYITLV